jgi:Na+-driven multidrug efflux pump
MSQILPSIASRGHCLNDRHQTADKLHVNDQDTNQFPEKLSSEPSAKKPKSTLAELLSLLALAAPLAASFFLQRSIQTISLIFIGRYSPHDLGNCALGNMMYAP